MRTNYTESQLAAIEATDPDVCVCAGAGSGKTGVLVARYIRLLEDGVISGETDSPDGSLHRILVITFTDRAAREMKLRIAEELSSRGLLDLRRNLDQAYISTIHSFCARLLRENPLEANVDPAFKIMDEAEANRMLRRCTEAVFSQVLTHDALLDPRLSPIQELIQTYITSASGHPSDLDTLTAFATEAERTLKLVREAGIKALDLEPAIASAYPYDPIQSSAININGNVLRPNALQTAAAATVGISEKSSQEACRQLLMCIGLLWKKYETEKLKSGLVDHGDLQLRCVELLETHSSICSRYRTQFKHLLIDEFQDTNSLQLRILNMLHPIAAIKTEAERGNKDTNVSQNCLFLVGDVRQSIYGFRNADPEIFKRLDSAFRNGNVPGTHVELAENFRTRQEILRVVDMILGPLWIEHGITHTPMISRVPFKASTEPCVELLLTQDMARRDYVRYEAKALAERLKRMVEAGELETAASAGAESAQRIDYSHIMVLMRSLVDIQTYEEEFARRNVPCVSIGGGRGFYTRPEVQDLMSALSLIDCPLDDTALAAVLCSPFVGVDADTLVLLADQAEHLPPLTNLKTYKGRLYPALLQLLSSRALPVEEINKIVPMLDIIHQLQADQERTTPAVVLERLVYRTGYDQKVLCRQNGKRRLANVRKLIQMALDEPQLDLGGFVLKIRELDAINSREGDARTSEEGNNTVRFLTIHAAKGLEAPVVVVPDLSRGLLRPEAAMFACDVGPIAIGSRITGKPDSAYAAILERKAQTDRQEFIRLLYVALTRAREHLILCGNVGRNRGYNWADIVFSALNVTSVPLERTRQTLECGAEVSLAPQSLYVS